MPIAAEAAIGGVPRRWRPAHEEIRPHSIASDTQNWGSVPKTVQTSLAVNEAAAIWTQSLALEKLTYPGSL